MSRQNVSTGKLSELFYHVILFLLSQKYHTK